MNRTGKEIMACRIAEAIKDTLSKKESSAIPLHWKQDTDTGTATKGKGDMRPNMEESADDTEKNQSLQMERDENCNSNSDTSTLQCGVTSAARHSENISCSGVVHTLTHSSISRQHREQM